MFECNNVKSDLSEQIIQILSNELSSYIDFSYEKRSLLFFENKRLKLKYFNKQKKHEIFKFYSNKNKVLINKSVFVPSGLFCFPITDSILRSNCYELNYMENFPSFKHFDKSIEDVILIQDTFHVYPNSFDYKEKISNSVFWIWAFIKIVIISHFNHKITFDEENIYKLISYLSLLLGKDPKYLYRLISKFLWKVKLISKDKEKKYIAFSNYRMGYCQMCRKYFCNVHFYNSIKEKVYHGIKIVSSHLAKLSGERHFLYKKGRMSFMNDYENTIKCQKNLTLCKLYFEEEKTSTFNCSINKLNNFGENHFQIFSKMNKEDFYYLNGLITTGLFSNSCLISRMFQYKYKCIDLNKIISIITRSDFEKEIDLYLSIDTFGGISLPIISNEKMSIIFNNIAPGPPINSYHKNNIIKLNTKEENYIDYLPCNHPGDCEKDICDCYKRGGCEKFCFCQKNCAIKFRGCKCISGCPRNEENDILNDCQCIQLGRECDPDLCPNCVNCNNMKMYYKQSKKAVLGKSKIISSNGLFAYEDIKKFELIGVYEGEIVEKKELERRSILNEILERNYAFSSTVKYDIDAFRMGNSMRYINHSSFGYENCMARSIYVRGSMKIGLFALRNIPKGHEIYFDYKMKELPWVHEYNKKYGD